MSLGNIVEGQDRPAKPGKEEAGEGDESVKWELYSHVTKLSTDHPTDKVTKFFHYLENKKGEKKMEAGMERVWTERYRRTTGTISVWTVSFRGIRPR